MRRWCLAGLALAGGMLVNVSLELRTAAITQALADDRLAAVAAPGFEDLAAGKLRIVDLAWPLNRQSAYWPGDNYKPFELHTIATLEKDGVLSKAFASPEHLGTHLDAPNHFERNQPSVDQILPEQLFGPGVVIDVSNAVGNDPNYRVSLDDVRRFEQAHGEIPTGAVVLVSTGWSQFWNNPTRYQNQDVMGRMHFPGFSIEAVKYLIDQRKVRGVGLDTMSVDYGLSRDFAVHHALGKAGRWGLENLAGLDKLPPRGFYLFVAPMKIETGSGGPARVFAVITSSGSGN
ncbi:MAG TPA: cyclase family protein [Pirellulales bacterium]|jgi:kynurenine formamidase|nr:cyclase family protein [Pirellulales bacterium]